MDPTIATGVVAVVTALASCVAFLFREMKKLQEAETTCRGDLASVRAQLLSLHALVEQVKQFGDSSIEAMVVADANSGLIVEWNPAATIMLHWTQREILGKPMTTIIPERFRPSHLAGMAAMINAGRPPRHGPYEFVALTKDGGEVPIEVLLSGWQTGQSRYVSAAMRMRDGRQ